MYDYNAPWYKYKSIIKKVVIHSGVTSIGSRAFWAYTGLTEVTIPEGVARIGEYAFYNCTGLTEVTIPGSVTSIEGYAFYECTGLTQVTIHDGATSIGEYAFYWCSKLTDLTIPEILTSLGELAFCGCKGLTDFTIPKSLTSIGGGALSNTGVENIFVQTGNSYYCSKDGIVFSKDESTIVCYPAGRRDLEYTIPDSVTYIGEYAFYEHYYINSITIPDGVTCIGNFAFYHCFIWPSIIIPDSVTTIGAGAFSNCKGLTSIQIPNSVTTIGTYAFSECTGLSEITIPSSVNYLGTAAFSLCYLRSVTILSSSVWIEGFSFTPAYHGAQVATIYGYNGSSAEAYAAENDLPFVALEGDPPDAVIPIFFDDLYPAWYKTEYFSKENPSTESNNDLAMMAGILSWAVYGDDGKPSMRSVYKSLGISDSDIAEVGGRDEARCYSIARKRIRVDGVNANLLIIDARGTLVEGVDDHFTQADSYFFGQNAYGLVYQFEDKIMKSLNGFLAFHPEIKEQPLKVLITGHSLGGAAANLLGARFTMHANSGEWWSHLCSKEDIYVYTFAAIDSIDSDGTIYEGYENIHNITNFYDTFGPEGLHIFTAAGNSRYGKYGHIDIFYKNIMNVFDVGANHMWGAYLRAVRDHEVQYENPKAQKIASMHCPVDVDVYRDNVLVGRVVNNEVVSEVSTIPISVANDVKYFALLGDGDYSFDIKATDDGEMKINVADAETGHANRTFDNIALTTGKQMYTAVYEDAPLEEMSVYVVDGQQTILSEVQEDGTETAPSEDACIHVWNADYTVDKEATYVEDGSESRHCEKCGRKKTGTERVIPKLILFGDLTGDGEITMADVVMLNRYVLGKLSLTPQQKALADVNKDGDITMADVILLNRYVVGLLKKL